MAQAPRQQVTVNRLASITSSCSSTAMSGVTAFDARQLRRLQGGRQQHTAALD